MAPPHFTASLPLIMPIPRAKLNSPLRDVNSTVTGSLSGSLRSILYSLITTSLAQVSSVFRTKVTIERLTDASLQTVAKGRGYQFANFQRVVRLELIKEPIAPES